MHVLETPSIHNPYESFADYCVTRLVFGYPMSTTTRCTTNSTEYTVQKNRNDSVGAELPLYWQFHGFRRFVDLTIIISGTSGPLIGREDQSKQPVCYPLPAGSDL